MHSSTLQGCSPAPAEAVVKRSPVGERFSRLEERALVSQWYQAAAVAGWEHRCTPGNLCTRGTKASSSLPGGVQSSKGKGTPHPLDLTPGVPTLSQGVGNILNMKGYFGVFWTRDKTAEWGGFVSGFTGGRGVQEAYKEKQDWYRFCWSDLLAKTEYSPHLHKGWSTSGTRGLLQSATDFKVEWKINVSTNTCTHIQFCSWNKVPAFQSKSCWKQEGWMLSWYTSYTD